MDKLKKISNRFGFTLLELVIVTGIFGVVLTFGTALLIQTISSANKANVESEIRQNVSSTLEVITRAVRRAPCAVVTNTAMASQLDIYPGYDGIICTGTITSSFVFSGTPRTLTLTENGLTSTIISTKLNLDGSSFTNRATVISPVVVNITAVANYGTTRSDYQAAITQNETITLRRYDY